MGLYLCFQVYRGLPSAQPPRYLVMVEGLRGFDCLNAEILFMSWPLWNTFPPSTRSIRPQHAASYQFLTGFTPWPFIHKWDKPDTGLPAHRSSGSLASTKSSPVWRHRIPSLPGSTAWRYCTSLDISLQYTVAPPICEFEVLTTCRSHWTRCRLIFWLYLGITQDVKLNE